MIGFGVGAGANILAQFAVSMSYTYYVLTFDMYITVFQLYIIFFSVELLDHYCIIYVKDANNPDRKACVLKILT